MLNDWKKYGESEWYKKDDKYSFSIVWKVGLLSYERKRRGIELWGFRARIGRNGTEIKHYFKSKPQALKFAKSYMMTH